jgi:hypothetical protein
MEELSDVKKYCTICKTELLGEYCYVCGQQHTGRRVSFMEWVGDWITGMFSLERSVFASWWLVIHNPQIIIENYWAGNRGYYHSPGKLAFYAASFIGLHFAFFGYELLGLNLRFSNIPIPPQLILIILLIPLYTVISKLTFFRMKRRFLEHLIAMVYLFSTWIVIFIVIDDLQWYFFDKIIDTSMVLIFIIILFIWNTRLHATSKKWTTVVAYTLLQLFILLLIISLLISLMYFVFPDTIQVTETPVNN